MASTVSKSSSISGKFMVGTGENKQEVVWGNNTVIGTKSGLTFIEIGGKRLGNFRTNDKGHRYGMGDSKQVFPLTQSVEQVVKAIVKAEMTKRDQVAKAKAAAKAAKAAAKEAAKEVAV